LIHAELALKRGEKRAMAQRAFDFRDEPVPVLRAVQVSPNEFARSLGLIIFPNMRVPECSIIHGVFSGRHTAASARENLSDWESSDGTRLPDLGVLVQARKNWDGVQALITPAG
jgi:hypothetical protein